MRNNEERLGLGAGPNVSAEAPPAPELVSEQGDPERAPKDQNSQFSYVAPTEIVDLPSMGQYYSEGHPLHNKETIEIRYMTAKDEDILTSESLIKKGLVIERLLQNILVDKAIDPLTLLSGDRNAILIAARITGFGPEYEVSTACPSCNQESKHTFDLYECPVNTGEIYAEGPTDVQKTDNNTFLVYLPRSGVDVEIRLLNGYDEKEVDRISKRMQKLKMGASTLTNQFKQLMVSVNGETDFEVIGDFIENMPAMDSRYIRKIYEDINPDLVMELPFHCSKCGEQEDVEVPLTSEFFWPKL